MNTAKKTILSIVFIVALLHNPATGRAQTLPIPKIPNVLDRRELWPVERPFSDQNLKLWAENLYSRFPNPQSIMRVITASDARELSMTLNGREAHAGYGENYMEFLNLWPKGAIAQLIVFKGRASLQIQDANPKQFNEYAREVLISKPPSPNIFEVNGRRYRLLHFRAEMFGDRPRLAVFFQSETRDIDKDSGALLIRLLVQELHLENLRLMIRPDWYFTDAAYQTFYRFPVDFGPPYFMKPHPPDQMTYHHQPELDCEIQSKGEIVCRYFSTAIKEYRLPR
jgi:hypothetical protein